MIKFGFKIKTRSGVIVDNLVVAAADRDEAERKLTQIYNRCEVLDQHEVPPAMKEDGMSLEHVLSLIDKEAGSDPPASS